MRNGTPARNSCSHAEESSLLWGGMNLTSRDEIERSQYGSFASLVLSSYGTAANHTSNA